MAETEFEYIVIGAGSAGCVVANRLSADPKTKVCVIEAGGSDASPRVQIPAGILSLYHSKRFDYNFEGVPQSTLNNRRLPVNRGKALGGSSAINSMVYIRGSAADYEEWAELGCPDWAWSKVLPVFKQLENNQIGQSETYHGTEGELYVDEPRDPNPVSRIFAASGQALGIDPTTDMNAQSQDGLGIYNVTQKDGKRWSSFRAFLHPILDRPNLTVMANTKTHRIVIEGGKATAVEIETQEGRQTLTATKEVILSAGAICTPELLMRSGVGPAQMLKAAGIDVKLDLPGVGQNLQDHIDGMITVRSKSIKTLGLSLKNLPAMLAAPFQWLFARKGMLTTNYVEAGGFARTKYANDAPDIQFHFVPGYRSHRGKLVEYGHGYAIHTCVLRPKSVGELRLTPAGELEIDHNIFSDMQDAHTLVEGIKTARSLLADKGFDDIRGTEMLPGDHVQSDEDILAYLRDAAVTVYHPVGTCKMGVDAMSVCDPATLKVKGLEGLRIADASIMPNLISGNTNAPAMMIGQKCSDMILQEAL